MPVAAGLVLVMGVPRGTQAVASSRREAKGRKRMARKYGPRRLCTLPPMSGLNKVTLIGNPGKEPAVQVPERCKQDVPDYLAGRVAAGIDAKRTALYVRGGKGKKARNLPLPEMLLLLKPVPIFA